MFESQYVELLPARTTMKACRPRKRGGSGNYHSGNTTNTGGAGGSGGSGGAGGFGVNVNVNPQIALFGDNSSSTTLNAGNGGAGGAGGAGGSAG
jgi:hypothetical protein